MRPFAVQDVEPLFYSVPARNALALETMTGKGHVKLIDQFALHEQLVKALPANKAAHVAHAVVSAVEQRRTDMATTKDLDVIIEKNKAEPDAIANWQSC